MRSRSLNAEGLRETAVVTQPSCAGLRIHGLPGHKSPRKSLPERHAWDFRPVATVRVLLGDLGDFLHQSGVQHDRIEAEIEQASVLHRKIVRIRLLSRVP